MATANSKQTHKPIAHLPEVQSRLDSGTLHDEEKLQWRPGKREILLLSFSALIYIYEDINDSVGKITYYNSVDEIKMRFCANKSCYRYDLFSKIIFLAELWWRVKHE